MDTSKPGENRRDLSGQWLHLLVESALDAIVTIDEYLRIISFNPAAEQMFGYKKESVIGKPFEEKLLPVSSDVDNPKELTRFLAARDNAIIGRRVEITAARSGGETFPAELEIISVHPGEEPVYIVYIRDISERVNADQERLMYSKNIKKILLQTLLSVSKALEIRDPYTAGHQRRVAHLAAAIGQTMGLPEKQIEGIYFGGLIHDIGKIAVPSEVLARPGKLRPEDIAYLKTHCSKGYEILQSIDFPWPVAQIALQHHEHLDGSGYPQGLQNGEILLEAQVIGVADVIDAMTSHRPYQPAQSMHKALAYIQENEGILYDSSIVQACCRRIAESKYSLDQSIMETVSWLVSPW